MKYGWSKHPVNWNKIPEQAINGRWESIKFIQPFNYSLVPAEAGIYMFVAISNNFNNLEFKAPMYIGHSTNIRSRLRSHDSGKRPGTIIRNLKLICEIHYLALPLASKKELEMIELSLTDIFGPTINEINPPSTGVKEGKAIKAIIKEANK